tara:strand:- start:15 stop:578 length:564 start_codon:yes stop_codon:yes gene_type:complete
MKFLFQSFAFCLVFVFCSCEDDNSSSSSSSSNTNPNTNPSLSIKKILPGNWNVDDVEQKEGKNFLPGTSTLVSTFTGVGENVSGTMVFSENPNTLNSTLEYDMKLDIKFQNPIIPNQTPTIPVPAVTTSGTWAFDADSSIVFTDSSNQKVFYTVENKTNNSLELSTPINTTITGQNAGFLLYIYLSK